MADFQLQLLHASDLEGGVNAVENAPNFAAIVDSVEDDYANTIRISAGDNYIPGPFFGAAGDRSLRTPLQEANQFAFGDAGLTNIREGAGRVDISIMNMIGFDASAIGNHEYDAGSNTFADLIGTDIRGDTLGDIRWLGADFPYLSSNLDFSNDGDLADLFTSEILPNTGFQADPSDLNAADELPKIAPATIIDVNGELVGVVGATTPLLESITSTGGTDVQDPGSGSNDMAALASILQPVIDDLADGDDNVPGTADDVNKIILTSHLQQIALEEELVQLLSGIDIVIAGGSDTLLANDPSELRPGDDFADAREYPLVTTNKDAETAVIVSTAGEYSYVGRLVVDFNDQGVIDAVDGISGPIATTDENVNALYGFDPTADPLPPNPAFADDTKGGEVKKLVDALNLVIDATDGNTFGITDVFLEGRRSAVRTEETNLGNLTADANLAEAIKYDPTVEVSIKNGGGIRAPIGVVDGETGELLPPQENTGVKEEGEISQLDIQNTLRFNNQLTLLTVTTQELKYILEHAVAASGPGNTPGQFPQIGGLSFSYDPTADAIEFNSDEDIANDAPVVAQDGSRIHNVALIDENGQVTEALVQDGVVINPNREIRLVTLNFLNGAFSSSPNFGGDDYPFPAFGENVVDLPDLADPGGVADFTGHGSEQDALAEYLAANFPVDEDPATPAFAMKETSKLLDTRIQDITVRTDTVLSESPRIRPLATYETGVFDESAAEIVAYDPETQRAFFTNAFANEIGVLDLSNPGTPVALPSIALPADAGGVNSVDVKDGLIAAAVANDDITQDGAVFFFHTDGTFIDSVTVGALPDSLAFSPDGTKVVVANEGEPDDNEAENPAIDPLGSISVVDVQGLRETGVITSFDVTQLDFSEYDGKEDDLRAQGIRIFPGRDASRDLEPEYVTISDDGLTAVVTLQEANAVAIVDLATSSLLELKPLGVKDHSVFGAGLDPSNRDSGINIAPQPVYGLYMPDAIASFQAAGQTYYVTANEGDSRDFDESRIGGIDLDPTVFPNAAELQEDENLGRLKISNIDGDIDGDGDFDQLFSYGARSFTIWDAAGNLVFDSGDDFEQITAEQIPELFNSDNDENSFDSRSDDKGPEPEAITTGVIDGRTYAFIGLERVGGIMVYDVSNPHAPNFIQYLNNRDASGAFPEDAGDLGVEDLEFIRSVDSPNGTPLLLASNEVSGTVSVFQLDVSSVEVQLIPVAVPTLADSTDLPDAITTSPVGGTYFVEVWIQDTYGEFGGIAGGQVDIQYTTDLLDVTGLSNEDFDLLTSGTIVDAIGLVDDLGGATLQRDQGVFPGWTRLGFVEVQSTEAGNASFSLSPGDLPLARFDGGNLDWSDVDLSSIAVVEQVDAAVIETRIVREETAIDDDGELADLPDSVGYVHEWEPFYVEFFLTDVSDPSGVGSVAFDFSYETSLTSASVFMPGPGFDLDGIPVIDDLAGTITGIVLDSNSEGLGLEPVLLGRILFETTAADDAAVNAGDTEIIGPYDLDLMIQSPLAEVFDSLGPATIGELPETDMWAVPYDFDDSDQIDFSDFARFADAFGLPVGTEEPPFARWADYDGSGFVDYEDLAFLSENNGLTPADYESLVFSCVYPTEALSTEPCETPELSDAVLISFSSFGPFNNGLNDSDVNNSGDTTAVDALLVINSLDRETNAVPYFLDVNNDGRVSALDALRVINRMGTNEVASAEGELADAIAQIPYDALEDDEDRDELLLLLARDQSSLS